MNVRFRGGSEPQSLGLRDVQIAIDVPFWIDDEGLAGLLTAYEIRVLGEPFVGDLPQQHVDDQCNASTRVACPRTLTPRDSAD